MNVLSISLLRAQRLAASALLLLVIACGKNETAGDTLGNQANPGGAGNGTPLGTGGSSGGPGTNGSSSNTPPILLDEPLKPKEEGQLTCLPKTTPQAIPATGTVFYVAMNGDDATGDGTEQKPFASVQKAADLAMPGDTVFVKEGTYRGRIAPPRGGVAGMPITYLAEPGKRVYLKGSKVWTPAWEKTDNRLGIYKAIPDPALFTDSSQVDGPNPLLITLARQAGLTLGQVYVDGERMVQMPARPDILMRPGTWHYQADEKAIYIHFPLGKAPETSLIELTTERRVFAPHLRGLGFITLSGFFIEHCANQYPGGFYDRNAFAEQQAGMVGTRSGHDWVIENNVIRYAQALGIDCGSESEVNGDYDIEGKDQTRLRNMTNNHRIVNNFIADNGTNGMMCFAGLDTLVQNNVFARNNWLDPPGAAEPAGIKVHLTTRFKVIGNLFLDNNTLGMYYDNNNRESRVSRNVFIGNDRAVFLELSRADSPAIVDNNIFIDNIANGVYSHDSSGARIVHNLIANTSGGDEYGSAAEAFFLRRVTTRVQSTNTNYFLANLVIGNKGGSLNLPYPCGASLMNRTDFNVYAETVNYPLAINLHCPMDGTPTNTPFPSLSDLVNRVSMDVAMAGLPPIMNQRMLPGGVGLSLEQWRAFWSRHNEPHDQKSMLSQATATLDRTNWKATINFDLDPATLTSEEIPGLDSDFLGAPLPTGGLAKPGPIQSLVQGVNEISLFECQSQ